MNAITYRDLDSTEDWPFFDADCAITEDDRATIRPLTQTSSEAFWASQVSSEQCARHGMLLPDNHWLDRVTPGPGWLDALAQTCGERLVPPQNGPLASFLLDSFALDPAEHVYFVLMRESAYHVPLGVFAKYHLDFLHIDDEAPFLLHPESGVFVRFGPNGQTWLGRR